MENDYPGIKPDKLLPLVQRMVGKKKKLSDYEIISEYLKELKKINSKHKKELNI